MSWACIALAAFPALFAVHAILDADPIGALTSLLPVGACALFATFAQLRHDRIIFGTPTPRWLLVACAATGTVTLMLLMLASMEEAVREEGRATTRETAFGR